MVRRDIQDFYFDAMDVLFEGGFCPKIAKNTPMNFSNNCSESEVERDDCKECISEFIMKGTRADNDILDLILGE